MRALPWALVAALGAAPALAQRAVPVRAGGKAVNTRGKVKVDYTEVRAGPGAAYLTRGRAYRGDLVDVLARDETGDWFEITADGVRGWVKMTAIDLRVGGGERARGGRDRRQTNYTYDSQGRRVFADGRKMGSGEGTAGGTDAPVVPQRSSLGPLRVRVGFGAAQINRDFEAAVELDSSLRKLAVSPVAFTTEIEVTWETLPWLQVRALFRDARLAESEIAANPDFGFPEGVSIETNAQQAELDVVGRYPLGPGWLGVYAGGWLFRQSFQETRPYALFLTNTFIGLSAGLATGWRAGPVEITGRGGLALPLATEQSPTDGGDAEPFGGYGAVEVAWPFHPRWAVVAHGHFTHLETDFSGGSTHADPFTGAAPRTYDAARETDQLFGGGLGVRWQTGAP